MSLCTHPQPPKKSSNPCVWGRRSSCAQRCANAPPQLPLHSSYPQGWGRGLCLTYSYSFCLAQPYLTYPLCHGSWPCMCLLSAAITKGWAVPGLSCFLLVSFGVLSFYIFTKLSPKHTHSLFILCFYLTEYSQGHQERPINFVIYLITYNDCLCSCPYLFP